MQILPRELSWETLTGADKQPQRSLLQQYPAEGSCHGYKMFPYISTTLNSVCSKDQQMLQIYIAFQIRIFKIQSDFESDN